jgi:hypothetical protein
MPEELTRLLADLQRVVQQMSDENGKAEVQPRELDQHAGPEIDPAPKEGADLSSKPNFRVAGLAIETEKMKVEQVDVAPEPNGRVRVTISVKKE